ncbi:MAG: hypothetical protein IT432_03985 [Phycisphaerales bacterium]|nr:hypothetical protein [Phycisphaerales bacterium]
MEQRWQGARGILAVGARTINTGSIIKLTVAALALLAAAVIAWRSIGSSAGTGEHAMDYDETRTRWLCLDAACKEEFTLSTSELGEFYSEHEDQNPPCPACKKQNTTRASRCEACTKFYVPTHEPPATGQKPKPQTCPHCGKPVR